MFETPTIDIQEIRSSLTEAGNTAAGFAVMAAKRANDLRLDATSRYSSQINEFRKQALVVVKRVESVRADMEAAVEPTLSKVIDRLPAPAAKVAAQAQEAVKTFQVKAHDMVVEALTAEIPAAKAASTVKPSNFAEAKAAPAPKTNKSVRGAKTAKAGTAVKAVKTASVANAVKSVKTVKAVSVARSAKAAKAVKPSAAKPFAKKVSRAAKPATASKAGRPTKAAMA